ncbi:MAG TPA: hypothetical protein VFV80_14200, partial [Geminicoccaceae bacterium]|nr:hypothetical protein [Geminicoccaceae bacterium]
SGFRTADLAYVEYGDGERELYDMRSDPFQVDNIVDEVDPAVVAKLSERLTALAGCAADQCRRLEDLPLPQPGTGLHATAEQTGLHVE